MPARTASRRPPRRAVGRPPGASGELRREAILEAALEAFGTAGYDAMSVRELTRTLGVSHNLVHHYFGSKRELWRAAIDHGLGRDARELFAQVDEPPATGEPAEVMRSALERFVRNVARNPAAACIAIREAAEGGERLDYLYEQYVAPGLAIAQRFLSRGRQAGLREVDTRSLLLIVGAAAMSLFTQPALARKLGGPDPASEESVDVHARAVADLVVHGLIAP